MQATYSNYWGAMRKDISKERPGLLYTFTDGTGGSRGTNCLHSEAGVGDWSAGKALSRLSIDAGALGEFKENNEGIRAHSCLVMAPSVNKVIKDQTLDIFPMDAETQQPVKKTIPIKVRHNGDFQFHKYCSGQRAGTHPIFCTCVDFPLPDESRCFNSYEDIEEWVKEVGCKPIKDLDLHIGKHLSLELTHGLPFKPFGCLCGEYWGSENQYLAYVADFEALSPGEKVERRKAHFEGAVQIMEEGEKKAHTP